jgi:hypothetical protein
VKEEDAERRRRAFGMLSSIGAALAGLGAGALLGSLLASLAVPTLAVGLAVHLLGMVGMRHRLAETSYAPSRLEQIGYWTCWVLIVGLAVYAAAVLLA